MNQKTPARSFLTTRPVAITMVFVAVTVFGLLSYFQLPVKLMPELSYPTITVRTEYPGAAPEEVENDISRPIEEAVGVVGSLANLRSVSRAGISDVILEFAWDTPMSDATQGVLEKLDQVFLPEDANRPLILHYDPSEDPILELSLSGQGDGYRGEAGLRRLRRLADMEVKRALEPIKGVAAVRVRGGLEEEIHVLLDEAELARTGIAVSQVIERLAAENVNMAGGTIKDGRTEYMVRTLGEFSSLEEIGETIVASFDQRQIRLADIAEITISHKEREIVTRTDGGESVQIEIYKEADANIVAVAHRVKNTVGKIVSTPEASEKQTRAGPGSRASEGPKSLAQLLDEEENAKLQVVADRSLFIESSINEVRSTAMLGGLLAIAVLLIFLRNLRSTMIIALSIPVSLLVTFAPLKILGVSLNIMSLGGLALGIGMLVDSSIVVLESIHRCREEGDDLAMAVERGTREVRSAVLASTLTSIAVFLPMVFIEGVAGQAFGNLGLAVVVSLLASAAVALFLIPMLGSLEVRTGEGDGIVFRKLLRMHALEALMNSLRGKRSRLFLLLVPYFIVRFAVALLLEIVGKLLLVIVFALLGGTYWVFSRVLALFGRVWGALSWKSSGSRTALYPRVLRAALAHPLIVFALVGLCLWGSWRILETLDSELLPEVHQGEFTVEVALPVGTPIEYTEELLTPVEAAILEEKQQISSLLLTLGFDSANSQRSDEGEHTARFKVLLERGGDIASREAAVIERLRIRFAQIPDLETRVVRPVLFSSKTPIEVEVHGDDLSQIKRYADRARDLLSSLPELADVETTLRSGAPEVQVIYDRDRLSRLGLNIGQVARLVRDKVKGQEATRLKVKDRRIPIIVRLAPTDRETVDEVRGLIINPGGDHPIPLSAVAEVTLGEGPSEVRRIDGQRAAVINASLASGSLSRAAGRIERVLEKEIDWPLGVSFLITGQQEEWEASRRSLFLVLAMSVFLVYVIMAAQFESLIHPLVIMLTIPLAFIGTLLALKVLEINLSVVVFLGMIMLAGIVVNNAIVLVDYINTLRQRGMERTEAIVTAGQVRLRPILMTTATTVFGLFPMALGFGDGAEIRTPMAVAVISGLLSSTLLTLIVIPTVYAYLDGLFARVKGPKTREQPASDPGAPSTVSP